MRPAETTMLRAGSQVLGTMPNGMGQFRLAQRWWWWRRPPHRLLEQRIADGPRLLLDLGDRTQALAFMTRRYCPALVSEILRRLPPTGGTFLDVGANVGLITFQVVHHRPAARTVAFEPNPPAAALWRRNRALNPAGRVELETAAVGAAAGVLTLHAPEHDLGAGRVEDGLGTEVGVVALDTYCAEHGIGAVDVLKLDVEGSEGDALDGARGLLAAGAVRAVVIEINEPLLRRRGSSGAALLERLQSHGLRPVTPFEEGDVVFELKR